VFEDQVLSKVDDVVPEWSFTDITRASSEMDDVGSVLSGDRGLVDEAIAGDTEGTEELLLASNAVLDKAVSVQLSDLIKRHETRSNMEIVDVGGDNVLTKVFIDKLPETAVDEGGLSIFKGRDL
jgi:hypothetical protein